MLKVKEKASELGLNADGFWSLSNNDYEMNQEEYAIRNSVIYDGKIPDDLDLLLLNKASETSIKIDSAKSPVDYMIIHNTNEDEQIQARGRYCGDLKNLYLHTVGKMAHMVFFPAKYLGKPLDAKERHRIAEELALSDGNHSYKWTNIKKELKKAGYVIQETRKHNKNYQTILLPKSVGTI